MILLGHYICSFLYKFDDPLILNLYMKIQNKQVLRLAFKHFIH